jgi:hypothetical protein
LVDLDRKHSKVSKTVERMSVNITEPTAYHPAYHCWLASDAKVRVSSWMGDQILLEVVLEGQ